MSWFKKPVAYRSYSDGTYEIIERRSFLRIGAAVLAVAATLTGGAFMLKSPAPIGPGSDAGRDPHLTTEIMMRILAEHDTDAVYRVLPNYSQLDSYEKFSFWTAVEGLEMYELAPFGEYVRTEESDQDVLTAIASVIEEAGKQKR